MLGAGGVLGGAWLTGGLQAIARETEWEHPSFVRELFAQRCKNCHTLAAAKATARVGPNLDDLEPSQEQVAAKVRGAELGTSDHQQHRAEQRQHQRRCLQPGGPGPHNPQAPAGEGEARDIAEQGGVAELGHPYSRVPGGEVERVLSMVDSVLLLVDAAAEAAPSAGLDAGSKTRPEHRNQKVRRTPEPREPPERIHQSQGRHGAVGLPEPRRCWMRT